MSFDSDVVLIGTGLAPLISAKALLAEGKSVLLLNPDWDYFQENSELSLDPLCPVGNSAISGPRIKRSTIEEALRELRPDFPGPLEQWPKPSGHESDFEDPSAPHVRSRARLWLGHPAHAESWDEVDRIYIEASDLGLNPQLLEGLSACRKFPGMGQRPGFEEFRGVLIPKLADVDVSRYRNGILEFVRDRMPVESIVRAVSQIELTPEGVRFYSQGSPRTARIREGVLVFWTPRLTSWILSQARRFDSRPELPRAVRLWEEWSLMSREALDPAVVGTFEDMSVWAEVEGAPSEKHLNRLGVLRPGPELGVESSASWVSESSFEALSRLCQDFLRWEKFSIRSLRTRAVFEWENEGCFALRPRGTFSALAVKACDGPLFSIIRAAHLACKSLEARA